MSRNVSRANKRQLKRLLERDGSKCHYCLGKVHVPKQNEPQNVPSRASREHVVPRNMGGSDDDSNMLVACRLCNSSRGNNIYFCGCAACIGIINKFLSEVFNGHVRGPAKPKVWKHRGQWVLSFGLISESMPSWESAMKQVPVNVHA